MGELEEYNAICEGMIISFVNKLKESPTSVASIESFIIEEAIEYYLEREEYELLQLLKEFQDNFSHKIIKVTRHEFFNHDDWHTL
jgi:hypothetical protein